jgi:transcriptional regulator with XRE-family HTH domain
MPVVQLSISISSMARMARTAEITLIGSEKVAEWACNNGKGAPMPIGDRIKQLRSELRLSQGDLAAKLGADAGQISRYENGHISPSADAIVRLAQALDVSCDYLLVDDAPRRPFKSSSDVLGDRLAGLSELSPDDLASLLNVLDALVTKSRFKALAGGIS